MKFRDITKKIPTKQKNLLTGKAIKTSKYKKTKASKSGSYISSYEPSSLNLDISEKYEGEINGVAGLIKKLPKEIQTFINNANLISTVARQGYTLYKLDNGHTVKLTDVTIGKHNKLNIIIKKGRNVIINENI